MVSRIDLRGRKLRIFTKGLMLSRYHEAEHALAEKRGHQEGRKGVTESRTHTHKGRLLGNPSN